MHSMSKFEDVRYHQCKFGTTPKPQRQQERQSAASSASTSEHTRQQLMKQTQRNREDVHCGDDSLGRGEASMDTDGEYSTEQV